MEENSKDNKKKLNSKQIVAIIGIILMAGMYVWVLIEAIIAPGQASKPFSIAMMCTLVVPILVWGYTWLFKRITNRK